MFQSEGGGSETYCCLGRAVPDGDVVFVLHRDSPDAPFTVWNPRNGASLCCTVTLMMMTLMASVVDDDDIDGQC